MPDPNERAAAFIADLKSHREDRGLMATLRRGFSDATADRTWPYLARWCNLTDDRQRTIYQTVSAAFATNPETAFKGNMGDTMHRLAAGDGRGEEGLKTFETRFRRLLACDTAIELCDWLPTIIRTTHAKGIPINHEELFKDLYYWGYRVKVRWASYYWGGSQEEEVS